MDRELILRAATYAAAAHERQRRKTGDQPYINHLLRVARDAAEAGLSDEAVAAALLHDAVEDTKVTLKDLQREFPARVAHLVHLLTQGWPDDAPKAVKEREKPRYYGAILADEEAVDLKLLDRADNLRDMARMLPRSRRWAENYLRRTEEELSPLHEASRNALVRERYGSALRGLRRTLDALP